MGKYDGRFKVLEKKLPKEAEAPLYSFSRELDGTYTDDCDNVYTAEEFEALTCNKMIFDWPSCKHEDYPEIYARQLAASRRLKYLYDKERLKYGLKPAFGVNGQHEEQEIDRREAERQQERPEWGI